MRRFVLATVLLLAVASYGQDAPIPAPPQVGASGYILVDFDSGDVLAESNADEQLEPASLTKLMTSYVAFAALREGSIRLDDLAFVSEKAWRTEGSRSFIDVNTQVPVDVLLRGMIIQSGNDASVALAEHVAGSEEAFVDLMNQYAVGLGMSGTSFRNSTGLPADGHHSTARDNAIIARAIIAEFPEYYELYSEREFTHNDIRQPNRNTLLWRDASVDGLKTGHTDAAGYCLVSSAQRDGMRLIAVVMGAASEAARLDSSLALLNYGFRFFETSKVLGRGEPISESRVWKGASRTVALGVDRDVYVTAPRGQRRELIAEPAIDSPLIAPLAQNESVGTVTVRYRDQEKLSVPLLVLETVEPAGLWTRLLDEISLWFE